MAEVKIKDLIRKLVFQNKHAEHEYTEQMANIVFDRNDTAIENAYTESEKIDTKIKKINAALDKKDAKIKATARDKKEMTAETFRAAMQKLNKQKNILKELQQTTIREKMDRGFPALDTEIKKYACLRHLVWRLVEVSDFPTTQHDDGFLYADEDAFFNSDTARNFREISDYVDDVFGRPGIKMENEMAIERFIKNDAKDLGLGIPEKITPQIIVDIHNALNVKRAKEAEKNQELSETIAQSKIGIKPIRDFGDGFAMYRLMPDTEYYNEHGVHRNLKYESTQMGICIGDGSQAYSKKILNEKENQYYTLRVPDKNGQMIPHCTIEVNGNIVTQVKGTANGPVNVKYITTVREFLRNDLNCAFPGDENTTNKRKIYDLKNIGFINDAHGKQVDLFNLAPGTELAQISLDTLKTRGIKIENIKSVEEIRGSGKISDSDLEPITHLNAKGIDLDSADLSNVTKLNFGNAEYIYLSYAKGLHGKLIAPNAKKINLEYVDLSNVTKLNLGNAENINLSYAKGLHGELIAPNAKKINLDYADLSNVTKLNLGNAENINLYSAKGLHDELDFTKIAPNAKKINLESADLSNVTKLNLGNVEYIYLSSAKGLHGELDFTKIAPNAKEINLWSADLSNVTKLDLGNAENIHLYSAKGLHDELDFTKIAPNAKKINLEAADLSNVTGIKIKDPKIIRGVDVNTLQKLIIVGATNKLNATEQQSNNKKIIVPKHPVHS